MKHSLLFLLSVLVVSSLLATSGFAENETDSRAAKGACFFDGKRILMTEGIAELKPGLKAVVRFRPGYSMTFVDLSIVRENQSLSKATMWIAGEVNLFSKPEPTSTSDFNVYNALSLNALLPEGRVCCDYNFYVARAFQGDPSQACL